MYATGPRTDIMTLKMLKIGLVGVGFMGRMHSTVYRAIQNAKLIGIYDHNAERAATHADEFGVTAYGSFDDLLNYVDAVDICLPTHLHRELAVKALLAGKDVLCEKPMALTMDDARTMIEAQKYAGRRLMIAHCIRFWPEYALLKQYVEDERFGKLLSLNLTRYGEFPHWGSENWLADESLAGGGALDMHIHDTDYALYLLGEPTTCFSAGTVDDRGVSQIFTTFAYPSGQVIHLEGGWNLMPGTPFKMAFRAIFEKASVIMDGGPMAVYEEGKAPVLPQFEKMATEGGGNISDLGGYYHEIVHFVDKILTGDPFDVTTPESSLESLRITLDEISEVKSRYHS